MAANRATKSGFAAEAQRKVRPRNRLHNGKLNRWDSPYLKWSRRRGELLIRAFGINMFGERVIRLQNYIREISKEQTGRGEVQEWIKGRQLQKEGGWIRREFVWWSHFLRVRLAMEFRTFACLCGRECRNNEWRGERAASQAGAIRNTWNTCWPPDILWCLIFLWLGDFAVPISPLFFAFRFIKIRKEEE